MPVLRGCIRAVLWTGKERAPTLMMLSARKNLKYAACSCTDPLDARMDARTGVDRPVPRWSSRITRQCLTATLSQAKPSSGIGPAHSMLACADGMVCRVGPLQWLYHNMWHTSTAWATLEEAKVWCGGAHSPGGGDDLQISIKWMAWRRLITFHGVDLVSMATHLTSKHFNLWRVVALLPIKGHSEP